MAKSLRSKSARRLRAVKRAKNVIKENTRLVGILQSSKEDVEMKDSEEMTENETSPAKTDAVPVVERMEAVSAKKNKEQKSKPVSNTETTDNTDVEMLTEEQMKEIASAKKTTLTKHKKKRLASKKKRGQKMMKW